MTQRKSAYYTSHGWRSGRTIHLKPNEKRNVAHDIYEAAQKRSLEKRVNMVKWALARMKEKEEVG